MTDGRCVTVFCEDNGSARYDGRYWSENIDSIVELNGEKVNGESLGVDHFKNGDKIKYRYQKKVWKGTVAEPEAVANKT